MMVGCLVGASSPVIYEWLRTWKKSREERSTQKDEIIWLRMDFLQTQIDLKKDKYDLD